MSNKLGSQILPLVFALLVCSAICFVCYHIYTSASKMREHASQHMAKRSVTFSKDGMRVGVRQVDNERYVDATQSWVVKAWNLAGGSTDGAADKRK